MLTSGRELSVWYVIPPPRLSVFCLSLFFVRDKKKSSSFSSFHTFNTQNTSDNRSVGSFSGRVFCDSTEFCYHPRVSQALQAKTSVPQDCPQLLTPIAHSRLSPILLIDWLSTGAPMYLLRIEYCARMAHKTQETLCLQIVFFLILVKDTNQQPNEKI
jgi:hypothetical protein